MDNKEEKQPKESGNAWWAPALLIFARLSGWIFFPVILAIFVGRWLDEKYSSHPWLSLLSIGAAFVISMFGLASNAIKELNKWNKENKDKK
ncbi:MAG: AtpZ/AtpI family protein [Patescibacteria group bacterium]